MNKFILKGKVQEIGDLIQIRRVGKPDLFKRVLTIEVNEGGVLYPEIRNNNIKVIEKEGIEIGSNIEMEFSFQGTEKDNKKYNNILVESIKLLK